MNTSMQHPKTDDLSTATQDGRTAAEVHPIIPRTDRICPDWCRLPAGHGWESINVIDGREYVQRYHVRPVSVVAIGDQAVHIDIMTSETVPATAEGQAAKGYATRWERPEVAIQWPERPVDLGADDARRLAIALGADLRKAGEVLDKLNGR